MIRHTNSFPKGHVPWNKGKVGVYSAETLKKFVDSHLGQKPWNKGSRNISFISKVCERCGNSYEGEPKIGMAVWMNRRFCSKSCATKNNKRRLGTTHSIETRKKISLAHPKGKDSPYWIKDRSKLKRFSDIAKDRRSYSYTDWRRRVLKRDNYACLMKDERCAGRLEVHHILSYFVYPELRYDINNGITLCHAHHPRKRAEEKRLISHFKELVSVSKDYFV